MENTTYYPPRDGAVVAIRIFYAEDMHSPMATLAFAFGGTTTIEWDNINQRKKYEAGINGYTAIFDDRFKDTTFQDFVRRK